MPLTQYMVTAWAKSMDHMPGPSITNFWRTVTVRRKESPRSHEKPCKVTVPRTETGVFG